MNTRKYRSVFSYSLRKVREGALEGVRISVRSKRFLTSLGLPEKPALLDLHFDSGVSLPRLAGRSPKKLPGELGSYVRIGSDGEGDVAISESHRGAVVGVYYSESPPTTFFNSSVEQLAEFLLEYKLMSLRIEREGLTERDGPALESQLARVFNRVDSAAVADSQSWWALRLMELRTS